MDTQISPVMVAVLAAPFILLGIVAVLRDVAQSRRDRTDGVVASWGELRVTNSFLLLGYHANVRRIPLAGLTFTVSETASPAVDAEGRLVHVSVAGSDGEILTSSQPHTYGSVTGARMFEILANRASAPARPVVAEAPPLRWAA